MEIEVRGEHGVPESTNLKLSLLKKSAWCMGTAVGEWAGRLWGKRRVVTRTISAMETEPLSSMSIRWKTRISFFISDLLSCNASST